MHKSRQIQFALVDASADHEFRKSQERNLPKRHLEEWIDRFVLHCLPLDLVDDLILVNSTNVDCSQTMKSKNSKNIANSSESLNKLPAQAASLGLVRGGRN